MILAHSNDNQAATSTPQQLEELLKRTTKTYKLLHELHSPETATKTRIYSLLPKSSYSVEDISAALSDVAGITLGQTLYRPSGRFAE